MSKGKKKSAIKDSKMDKVAGGQRRTREQRGKDLAARVFGPGVKKKK